MAAAAALLLAAVFTDPQARAAGLSAELLPIPAGTSPAVHALRLIEAEGLKPWNPAQPVTQERPGNALRYRAVTDSQGRTAILYFTDAAPAVCRLRVAKSGLLPVWMRALRWCAGRLGVPLAETPPPAVSAPHR